MRTHSKARWIAIAGVLVVTTGVLAACGGDDDGGDTTGDATGEPASGGTVEVTLQEFAVGVEPAEVAAGPVTFEVTNNGPEDVHEFVVISTDLDPTALPTDKDGAVEEDGKGMEVVDEIEDIPVDDSQTLTVDLEAGPYVLICNIVQEEEAGLEAHYSEGMRAGFTVT
jgi:uncharacterized cupredoxin-like copper-binding protein